MKTILDRWNLIQDLIHQSVLKRDVLDVTVVAISKKQPFEKVQEAFQAGVLHFGENYVQEALPKIEESRKRNLSIFWHYVGALQTNKMNKIIPTVQYLHSIDQLSQVEKLEKMNEKGVKLPKLLVQLNLADENTKSGLIESQIRPFMESISQTTLLSIEGLMTFPPLQTDPEKNRPYFAKMMEWKETINSWNLDRIKIQELSMGVSSDFQVAIQEGSTMVRLGEILFGPRV